MSRRTRIALLSTVVAFAWLTWAAAQPKAAAPPGEFDPLVLKTREADVSFERFEFKGLSFALKKDPYTRCADVIVGDEKFALYIPKPDPKRKYRLKNTGKDDSHHENNSARLFVDADGDGTLARDEAWFANLPIRIGDKMFTVAAIEPDGSAITLKPASAPLRGFVRGRKCPPFEYKTDDGRTVSMADYAGKAFLLDVWSVT